MESLYQLLIHGYSVNLNEQLGFVSIVITDSQCQVVYNKVHDLTDMLIYDDFWFNINKQII
jgi:hypothetical protein